jgi:hypothetical protein
VQGATHFPGKTGYFLGQAPLQTEIAFGKESALHLLSGGVNYNDWTLALENAEISLSSRIDKRDKH